MARTASLIVMPTTSRLSARSAPTPSDTICLHIQGHTFHILNGNPAFCQATLTKNRCASHFVCTCACLMRWARTSVFGSPETGILDVGWITLVCVAPALRTGRRGLQQECRTSLDAQQDQPVFCRSCRLATHGSRCLFHRFSAVGRTSALEIKQQQHTRSPSP